MITPDADINGVFKCLLIDMRYTQYTIAKMVNPDNPENVSLILKQGIHKFKSADVNEVKPDIIIAFSSEAALDGFLRSAILVS